MQRLRRIWVALCEPSAPTLQILSCSRDRDRGTPVLPWLGAEQYPINLSHGDPARASSRLCCPNYAAARGRSKKRAKLIPQRLPSISWGSRAPLTHTVWIRGVSTCPGGFCQGGIAPGAAVPWRAGGGGGELAGDACPCLSVCLSV